VVGWHADMPILSHSHVSERGRGSIVIIELRCCLPFLSHGWRETRGRIQQTNHGFGPQKLRLQLNNLKFISDSYRKPKYEKCNTMVLHWSRYISLKDKETIPAPGVGKNWFQMKK
jgi:hypothetical protein